MRGFHDSDFDPQTLVLLEAVFDDAWLTLKSGGNKTVKPDELARAVLRLAMEGERDPIRLSDGALEGLVPATTWREASPDRSVTELAYAFAWLEGSRPLQLGSPWWWEAAGGHWLTE